MPSAPMCKVCGVAHFGAAHVWPASKAAPEIDAFVDRCLAAYVKTGGFDRVAYQREYMRRRRAKK